MKKIECCQHCTKKRTWDCHATCEDYLKERAKHEKYLESIRKLKKSDDIMSGYYHDKAR